MDGNSGFARALVALFIIFVLVFGSLLWRAWAAENPLVVGDGPFASLFFGSSESSSHTSGSAWG